MRGEADRMSMNQYFDWGKGIERCSNLEELFVLWRAAHLCEQLSEGYPDTYPIGRDGKKVGDEDTEKFRGSFCPDGVTRMEVPVRQPCTQSVQVLFILKEANLSGYGAISPETSGRFWFNECINSSTRKIYANRFQAVFEALGRNGTESFGYINLNKRGGFGDCNNTQLKQYVQKYMAFIIREIELLSPEIIVCCGCFDVVAEILGIQPWNKGGPQHVWLPGKSEWTDVYYVYHPACHIFEPSLKNLKEPVTIRHP